MKIITKRHIMESGKTHPAVGRCDCGTTVVLDGFVNRCEGCGREYNCGDAELAPAAH